MSNKNVDERIVQMKFDNQSFEKGAQQTMSTLDKLKQKLNFRGAVQGLDELGSAVDNIGMDGLAQSVGVVTAKFSAFEVMAITAISNITNKVMNLGERMLKSLSVDQLSSGWAKYEDKITSVQTIMAATASTWEENARKIGFAGTQMEFVNEQLDKLNWFSDETSFSFTDMTSNIGKFTSAGIELDKAVTAMEGISVWAAKSGQDAQSASRAYYNLAQAISVGAVKLIDWKSIENANMATIEFKQTAIDTALAMGTLKKKSKDTFETLKGEEVTVRNFNEGLKDGWFTSEVLMKTLDEYGKAATRLSEISDEYGITATQFLNGMEKYNESNANIIDIADDLEVSADTLIPLFEELSGAEYKLSLSAFKAAQEAKTFTEVLNATKDAVSTGWMNTFELIFGNYEETKKLWSNMAEQFYDIFAGGAEGRNNMIKRVLGDPWEQLSDKIKRAGISSKAFEQQLITTMRNSGVPIDELLEKWGSIEEVFKHVDGIGQYVKQTILSFTEPIQTNVEAITEATAKVEDFQKVVNQVIRGEFKSGKERVKNLTEAGYDYATVQGLVNKVWERNGHTWKDTTITMDDLVDVMGKMTDEELASVGVTKEQLEIFQELQKEAAETGTDLDELIDRLTKPTGRQLIFSSLTNMVEAFGVALQTIKDAWAMAFPQKSDSAIYRIIEGFHKFTEWLIMSEETSARVAKALSGVFNILGIIVDIISAIVKTLFPGVSKGATKVGDIILSFFEKFADATAKVREFLKSSNIIGQAVQLIVKYFHKGIDAIKNFIHKTGELPIVSKNFEKVSDKFKKIFDFFKKTFGEFFASLTQENADLETSLINLFNTIKKKAEEIINKIPFLKNVKDAFLKVFDAMKTVGEYFSEGFWQGLKKSASFIFGKIVDFITGIKDKIWELFDIHSPSGWAIETVWWIAKGVVEGLIQVTKWLVDKIRSFVKKIMGVSEDLIEGVPGAMSNGVENNMGTVIDSLKKVFSKVTEFLQAFFAWVKDGVVAIVDYIKSIPFETLYKIIKEIINILYVFAAIKMYFNIGEGMKKIAEAFDTVANAVSGFLKAKRLKTLGKVAISFAIAIAIITGALIALSRLSGKNLKGASEVLLSAMIILGAIMSVLALLDTIAIYGARTNMKKGILGGKGVIGNMALLLLSISASMVLIMIAVTQLINLMDKYSNEQLGGAIGNLLALFGFLIAIIELLNVLNSRIMGEHNGALKSVATILAILIAINLIIRTINKYFFTKNENGQLKFNQEYANSFLEPLKYMALLILAIGGVLAIITATAGKWGLKGAGLAILAIALSLVIIVEVVNNLYEQLSHMSGEEFITWGTIFISVLAVLGVMLLGIAEVTKSIKTENFVSGLLAVSLFAAVITGFVAVIAYVVKTVSEANASWEQKLAAFGGVIGVMIVMLVAIGVFAGVLTKIFASPADVSRLVSIVLVMSLLVAVIAGFIGSIAGSIYLLSQANGIENSAKVLFASLIKILIAITAFIFIVNYLRLGELKSTAIAIAAIAGLILVIGLVIGNLAKIAKDNMGGLLAAGTVIGVITLIMLGVVAIMSTIGSFSGASVAMMLSVAAVIIVLSMALYNLSKINPKILEHTATVIAILVVVLMGAVVALGYVATLAPEIAGAIIIVAGAVAAILLMLGYAFNAIKDFLLVLGVFTQGDAFAESMAKVFAAEKVNGFTDAINGASDSVTTAMESMSNAFDGVSGSITDLFKKGDEAQSYFQKHAWLAKLLGIDVPTDAEVYSHKVGLETIVVQEGSVVDKVTGGVLTYDRTNEKDIREMMEFYASRNPDNPYVTGEDIREELVEGYKSAQMQAIERYAQLNSQSAYATQNPEVVKAQASREEAIKNSTEETAKLLRDIANNSDEQKEKDRAFVKESYMSGHGNNDLLYSRQMEQQMRENSKALVEGTAEAIDSAGTTIGTAAGTTIVDGMVDAMNNGTIGSAFMNGEYSKVGEALSMFSGENGLKIDTTGISYYDTGYQDTVTEDLDGMSTVPTDLSSALGMFTGMQQTQQNNQQDLNGYLSQLNGLLGSENQVTLNLDGNVLGQIMIPYVNNGLGKVFVQSGR